MKGKVVGYWNKVFLMEIFRSMLHGFLPFYPPVSLTELWFETSRLKLHKLVDKVALDHKIDDVTSGRREVIG